MHYHIHTVREARNPDGVFITMWREADKSLGTFRTRDSAVNACRDYHNRTNRPASIEGCYC